MEGSQRRNCAEKILQSQIPNSHPPVLITIPILEIGRVIIPMRGPDSKGLSQAGIHAGVLNWSMESSLFVLKEIFLLF
jgi:hypothetical protein